MDKICIVVISIGFFLSVSHLLVQSLPIKNNEQNSKDKIRPSLGDILKNSYNSKLQKLLDDADVGPVIPNSTVGFVMFPKSFEGGNKRLHPVWRKNKLNLYPNITQDSKHGDQNTGDTSPANGEAQTEMTISLPLMKTDKLGNYMFEKWGFDLGDRKEYSEDSKEYFRGSPTVARFRAPENKTRYYTPDNYNLNVITKVCASRSTMYNDLRVRDYLKPRIGNKVYKNRPVWMDLRELIWKEGNSQECHTPNMTEFYKYINCAIKRNMRMEYLIPKYPLHQEGYGFFIQ